MAKVRGFKRLTQDDVLDYLKENGYTREYNYFRLRWTDCGSKVIYPVRYKK